MRATEKQRFWRVFEQAAKKHGVSYEELIGPGRMDNMVAAREDIAWSLRQVDPEEPSPPLSFPMIAALMGRLSHSSVIYMVRRAERRLAGQGEGTK